ncbi:MAG: protoporphyrinogen oxidase HemJ [Gammaproteobacteria bacterium]|mgnify:FL=1|jgi:putative membrane protein|nr:protoporphyrinogen oxidase HemJ [Gammaproteobacteria bacterium]MBT4605367.1 protoporphyrinogen oxidase HemJ [Thiotrichales bacterium]MBT3472372.1 protoporphyrinogen oxidase HemJ [Gammaproteobacteria bacterium]MBT3965933.1 protoporphyrinogen oxidase HemJ [Gammaproteobacteria bacterium]MBT5362373.1 protoporphyrinogen oxidase HemJ [Gammaproteobacteria bacterium]
MNRNFLRILQPVVLLLVVGTFYIQFSESYVTAKVIHLLALISWFAGLFYLPRLFVYHAANEDAATDETFKVMEHKLFHYIMTPAALLTLLAGVWIVDLWQWTIPPWLHMKLGLVALLLVFHYYCWHYLKVFKQGENTRPHTFYRFFNEIPTLLLIAIVILVVAKPF